MGWEYAPIGDACDFRIVDLPFATAEGVVTLAALVECLRQKPNSRITFEISDKARAWSDGLQLGQLIKGRWLSLNKFPIKFSRPAGCVGQFDGWAILLFCSGLVCSTPKPLILIFQS